MDDPMERGESALRIGTPGDAAGVQALMKESAAALFPVYYDERQTASAVRYVAVADEMLLADGTYFVLESGKAEIVACGGWSRRDRLYTGSGESDGDARAFSTPRARPRGFGRCSSARTGRAAASAAASSRNASGGPRAARASRGLALMATLPGVPLYLAYGFQPLEEVEVSSCPDGVRIAGVSMEKPIRLVPGAAGASDPGREVARSLARRLPAPAR